MTGSRRDGLGTRLAAVRHRVESACDAAGRDPGEVTVVAVTKHFPMSDVVVLHALGVRDVGENRDQEAAAKVSGLPPEVRADLCVHFVGQLQTNKVRSVARYADVVHSVDRARLVQALDRAARSALDAGERQQPLRVLLQVDLSSTDGQPGRGGAAAEDLPALADAVAGTASLELQGLMAVAPVGLDQPATVAAFARLAELSGRLQRDHPRARWVSAGMSGDLELAVQAAGATHLRVGTAILGTRPLPE